MAKIDGINTPLRQNLKNWLINGDMRISQRNTTFTAVTTGQYTLDRWNYQKAGAAVHTVTQDTDVPTLAQAGYLFQNSVRLNLTTPDTAIAAGDFVRFQQVIEGYNFANIAQKGLTLSFWVKATTAGVYCVAFRNSGNDRSYITEYTINATGTWEFKTVSISASPSAGTWNYTNGSGLKVDWVLAAGTTFQTAAGAWQSGDFLATSNQVNGVNTGATDFRITGAMINAGTVAAPFRLFGEDQEGEFSACQRYCQISGQGAKAQFKAGSAIDFGWTLPVSMRGSVSLTFQDGGTTIAYNEDGIGGGTLSSVSVIGGSAQSIIVRGTGAGGTTGNMLTINTNNFRLDSEL